MGMMEMLDVLEGSLEAVQEAVQKANETIATGKKHHRAIYEGYRLAAKEIRNELKLERKNRNLERVAQLQVDLQNMERHMNDARKLGFAYEVNNQPLTCIPVHIETEQAETRLVDYKILSAFLRKLKRTHHIYFYGGENRFELQMVYIKQGTTISGMLTLYTLDARYAALPNIPTLAANELGRP